MTLKLTLLQTGYITNPEYITIRGGGWKSIRLPALCALLEHSRFGAILFDTGYTTRFFTETAHFPFSLFAKVTPVTITPPETAVNQLKTKGIAPEAVQTIIISHFHPDHIGGLIDFPQAQYRYFAEAYQAVQNLQGFKALRAAYFSGLLPYQFEKRSKPINTTEMKPLPPQYAPFKQGFDLFQDQSALAVLLPGHAHAQMGLFVETTNLGRVFLIADACWHSRAYRELICPHPVVKLVMDNPKAYQNTLLKIHQFYCRNPNIPIIPFHCPEMSQKYVQPSNNIS